MTTTVILHERTRFNHHISIHTIDNSKTFFLYNSQKKVTQQGHHYLIRKAILSQINMVSKRSRTLSHKGQQYKNSCVLIVHTHRKNACDEKSYSIRVVRFDQSWFRSKITATTTVTTGTTRTAAGTLAPSWKVNKSCRLLPTFFYLTGNLPPVNEWSFSL